MNKTNPTPILFAFLLIFLGTVFSVEAATYYVRTDGGTATQCTGLADAPYSGVGENQACAFEHPFWAISPKGNNPTVMAGGDTLIIDGSNNAEYMIGYEAPNTSDDNECAEWYPYECTMRSVPSGPSPDQPTRILGKGWDSGCSSPPQLWGNERVNYILNLKGSNNVEVQCLEITDHSSCQQSGPVNCERSNFPFGKWADTGITAWDSENVFLKNINIHGLYRGIHAARIADWSMEEVRLYANSFIGWDGDIGAFESSNSGVISFVRSQIQYSGCGETYPGKELHNCYSQDQGGYGDGIGTHETGGIWVFDEVDISHNVSDGLDLLYHSGDGEVIITRSRFEGNAGNQVKAGTHVTMNDSILVGNCAYFNGKDFTHDNNTFNNCRGAGSPLAFKLHSGTQIELYNSTVTSNGDTIIFTAGTECSGTEKIKSRNNIFLGGPEFHQQDDRPALYYASGAGGNGDGPCGTAPFDDDYSIIWETKYGDQDCEGKANAMCQDPMLKNNMMSFYSGEDFDVSLQAVSPARTVASIIAGFSSLDFFKNDRGDIWDLGAVEFDFMTQNNPEPEVVVLDPVEEPVVEEVVQVPVEEPVVEEVVQVPVEEPVVEEVVQVPVEEPVVEEVVQVPVEEPVVEEVVQVPVEEPVVEEVVQVPVEEPVVEEVVQVPVEEPVVEEVVQVPVEEPVVEEVVQVPVEEPVVEEVVQVPVEEPVVEEVVQVPVEEPVVEEVVQVPVEEPVVEEVVQVPVEEPVVEEVVQVPVEEPVVEEVVQVPVEEPVVEEVVQVPVEEPVVEEIAKPLTCADSPQLCSSLRQCRNSGYFWFRRSCHASRSVAKNSIKNKKDDSKTQTTASVSQSPAVSSGGSGGGGGSSAGAGGSSGGSSGISGFSGSSFSKTTTKARSPRKPNRARKASTSSNNVALGSTYAGEAKSDVDVANIDFASEEGFVIDEVTGELVNKGGLVLDGEAVIVEGEIEEMASSKVESQKILENKNKSSDKSVWEDYSTKKTSVWKSKKGNWKTWKKKFNR